ncbi:Molybdate/tungstate transport system permease protein WtpB [uncultured archaeon]|nr:Molybdate/tungstate transport system permease protein WtpB [uncultured archaeon]
MGKDNVIWLNSKLLLIFFFLVFFAYPLFSIIYAAAFSGGAMFDAGRLLGVILKSRGLLWNSFSQAAVSTIFSLALGIPAAFILAKRDFPLKKALRALSLVPFVFPSVLVVLSFVIVFGNNGWLNNFLRVFFGFSEPVNFLYGFWGIILCHVFYNFPLVMRFVSEAWENTDLQMEEAARTLGAGRLSVFMNVAFPQLLPSILASASLVFIYCFTSFAIVLSFGGVGFPTFETEIYYQISRNLDFGLGAVLAIFQFVLLASFASVYFLFSRMFAIRHAAFPPKAKKMRLPSFSGLLEALFLAAVFAFIALPMLSIIISAFAEPGTGHFTLRAFEKIFSQNRSLLGTTPLHSMAFSLVIASISSLAATLFGLLASLRQSGENFVALLLSSSAALSVITLGFGYFLGFGSGNLFVIAIGHSVLAFPFAFRLISGALEKIDKEAVDAARTLGATWPGVFMEIQLPRIKNALFASLAFSFAVSLGELGFVIVLYDGIYPTMPVYIYRLISAFDLFSATAMGLVLISISFICFYAIEHFSGRTDGAGTGLFQWN